MKDVSISEILGIIVTFLLVCVLTGIALGVISSIAYNIFCKFM